MCTYVWIGACLHSVQRRVSHSRTIDLKVPRQQNKTLHSLNRAVAVRRLLLAAEHVHDLLNHRTHILHAVSEWRVHGMRCTKASITRTGLWAYAFFRRVRASVAPFSTRSSRRSSVSSKMGVVSHHPHTVLSQLAEE